MMNKYHVYYKNTDDYVCTMYTLTDYLNLERAFMNFGVPVEYRTNKITNKERKQLYEGTYEKLPDSVKVC